MYQFMEILIANTDYITDEIAEFCDKAINYVIKPLQQNF